MGCGTGGAVTLSCWITQYCHCETSEPATSREPGVTYCVALVTNLDDILSLTPSLIAAEAIDDRLQSRFIKVNKHGHIINLPLNKVATVEATSIGERKLQLLGKFPRYLRLDVRGDRLVVAPSG